MRVKTQRSTKKTSTMSRFLTYSELMAYSAFEERFDYLELKGTVGETVFGYNRHVNQSFYDSREWNDVRNFVIVRDNGCDLAHPDHVIAERPIVHHINPMSVNDIIEGESWIIDPEFLITTTHNTHNAIHYGKNQLITPTIPRSPGDTKLW